MYTNPDIEYDEMIRSSKPQVVIFDLDGTLCELKPESHKNKHTGQEKSIPYMYNIYLGFEWYRLIVLTGRKEKYREITKQWLYDNDYHIDEIIMQKKSTADKNDIFKRKILSKLQDQYDIVCMFDDNPNMSDVCKELGINFLLTQNNL